MVNLPQQQPRCNIARIRIGFSSQRLTSVKHEYFRPKHVNDCFQLLHLFTGSWKTLHQTVLTDSLSLLCVTQRFVLMAAITSSSSTQKGNVPGTCMRSSWRWRTRKSDLWPTVGSIRTWSFLMVGSKRALVALTLINSLWRDAVDGQEKHRLNKDDNNMPEDNLLNKRCSCRFDSHTKHSRKGGIIFFWKDIVQVLEMSSKEF